MLPSSTPVRHANEYAESDSDDDFDQHIISWYNRFTDDVSVEHRYDGRTSIIIPPRKYLHRYHTVADTPVGMSRQLLDNQRTLLSALLEFESNVSFGCDSRYIDFTIHHSGIRVSEDPGAGKTIISIALVASKIMPKARPIMCVDDNNNRYASSSDYAVIREIPDHHVFPCTIITVSRGVFGQWEDEIAKFSDLKVFSVVDVNAFRTLYIMVTSNLEELRTYDIILIKNGKMTRPCCSQYVEPINRYITSVEMHRKFTEMVRKFVFWRVINDDLDMSKLPAPTSRINAYSTINISATKKKYIIRNNYPHHTERVVDPWFAMRFPFVNINNVMNNEWTENMQLCNTKEFISHSLQRVKIHFRLRRVYNREGALINMLGGMIGDPNGSREIIEMLNGEAFDEAADKMGVSATSVGDIFRRILGNKHDDRQTYRTTLDFISTLDLDAIDEMDEPPDNDVYHQKHFYEQKPVMYRYPAFETKMNAVWDKCEEGIRESDILINRFQLNICEGSCTICTTGMDKQNLLIMLCCGKSFHQKCAFATANIRSNFKGQLTCMCPHCKSMMDPRSAFMTINGCSLTDIVEFDEAAVEDVVADEEGVEPASRDYKKATKLDHMVDIINGTNLYDSENIESEHGVAGFVEKDDRPLDQMQTVVFTRFGKSIKKIDERLTEDGISHRVLCGHIGTVKTTLRDFENACFKVLVVNGEKNAAGITMSFADNLIFMHDIADINISKQIVGRIDRYGRKYAGYVYRINYEHEVPAHVRVIE